MIFSVIKDEWRRVWNDEGVVLIMVFALFIYGVSYSLGYGGEVLQEVPVAVVVEGEGDASRRLVRMLDASPQLFVAHEVESIDKAERLLRERSVWGVIAVAPDFDEALLSGRQGRVAIMGDASYFLAYREVVEGAVATIQQANADIIEERDGRYTPPLIYSQRNLFNAELGYGIFVMPAVILLILQQTALVGVGMLAATRRERGERYPSSSPFVITIGRTITHLVIYALTLGFMLTVHYSLFHYPMRGVWWRCMAVLLPYIISVSLLAQALGELFRRRESSIVWLLWFSIPFLLVSGVSLPPQAFPRWLYLLGRIIPSSSAVDAWIAVQTMGAPLSDVVSEIVILWLLVLIYGFAAVIANRNSLLSK